MFEDDDEEDIYEAIYENGHWEWDTVEEALKFISNLPSTVDEYGEKFSTCLKDIEFKDDIDLWEQRDVFVIYNVTATHSSDTMLQLKQILYPLHVIKECYNLIPMATTLQQKFRKRLQRKTTDTDVVTLQRYLPQDVKDVVLFTAPSSILSPALINMLHLPTTERFLRALILCCQYHLQVSEVMANRTIELETKIPTEAGDEIEAKYRDDLEDLRLLVAKEYCTILSGEGEFAKYHHMGVKKWRSLSKKDAILFEIVLRVGIQIVWISLGRKHYNQIELEVNRIFKSDIYNSVEHKLHTNYQAKMNSRERAVMFGHCVKPGKKVNTNSPLINEVYCHRHIDYRLFGLGAVQYSGLSGRLLFFQTALSEPEERFKDYGITLGIIGLNRKGFDTMLKELKLTVASGSSSSGSIRYSVSRTSRASKVMPRKSTMPALPRKLFPDMHLLKKEEAMVKLSDFSKESLPQFARTEEHRLKWIRRVSARNALKKLKLLKKTR